MPGEGGNPVNQEELEKCAESKKRELEEIEKTEEPKSIKKLKAVEERAETPTSSSSDPISGNLKPQKKKSKFIYGNYDRYYGYRPMAENDPRIAVFQEQKDLFEGKEVLDIGCHTGMVTLEIARRLSPKSIDGIDIDKSLIRNANKFLRTEVKKGARLVPVSYHFGNYVLENDGLLLAEKEKYDTILCLSVTKWIQLNFGDEGLKRAFRRAFRQLRPGGRFVLEAQPFEGYARRKKLTEETAENFRRMQLLPKMFPQFLLSEEVGFRSMQVLSEKKTSKGFDRPILVFTK